MKKQRARPPLKIDWVGVTTDGGITRRVTPLMPDMSWLGEPRTERSAASYEVQRRALHQLAIRTSRDEAARRAQALALDLEMTTSTRRSEVIRAINEANALANAKCHCDICKG